MIIPVYKSLGTSSHQLAKSVGEKYGDKATHTGTLDPMAEGVLVVLTGEDRFKKGELSNWKKEYEFEILIGFETDSFDLLGLVVENDGNEGGGIDLKKLENILPNFIGKQTQTVPKFSAQRVAGKSGFDLAKAGKDFELQKNEIEIFNLEILESREVGGKKLLEQIQNKIKKVEGDFRQIKILNNWEKKLDHPEFEKKIFSIIKLRAVTSKRTYIRALVRDLGLILKIPMTTFSIMRTKNGEYKTDDCSHQV